jgi:hypothetical protein
MSRNAAHSQPQRGAIFQPRATLWVNAPEMFPSPERATQSASRSPRRRHARCSANLFRPFRALISFHVQPRALPWAGLFPPRWGFGWPKVEAAVERLQEYRTALITAAVTGKIDVRQKTKINTITP